MLRRILVEFFVPGQALPKGSPDIAVHRKTGRRFVRESDELYLWQEAVGLVAGVAARRQGLQSLLDTAVALELNFVMPRKKSAPKGADCIQLAATKPDIDKLERAILDALQGVIYTQDSRVTWVLKDMRAAPHGRPQAVGVHIRVGLDLDL
jgi:crossover junction endodeoxyribonuclease RusA